jgi:hypothetical protein
MRWTRWLANDDGRRERTSEIVWSRPPDAEAKRLRDVSQAATVANKPGTPRRARISREPSRRECRHVRRTCDDLRACSLPFCTQGSGCVPASGIPCALLDFGGCDVEASLGHFRAAGMRSHIPLRRHSSLKVESGKQNCCRPGQAKRDPGPITTDVCRRMSRSLQLAPQRESVVMGPGLRQDDSGGCGNAVVLDKRSAIQDPLPQALVVVRASGFSAVLQLDSVVVGPGLRQDDT